MGGQTMTLAVSYLTGMSHLSGGSGGLISTHSTVSGCCLKWTPNQVWSLMENRYFTFAFWGQGHWKVTSNAIKGDALVNISTGKYLREMATHSTTVKTTYRENASFCMTSTGFFRVTLFQSSNQRLANKLYAFWNWRVWNSRFSTENAHLR